MYHIYNVFFFALIFDVNIFSDRKVNLRTFERSKLKIPPSLRKCQEKNGNFYTKQFLILFFGITQKLIIVDT